MMAAARPGDILLFRLNLEKWLAYTRPWALLIAWFQGNPVTHTALVVDPDNGVLVEAWYPRVRKSILENVLEGCYDWEVVRPTGVTEEQQTAAVEHALSLVGRGYDVKSLWSLAKWLLLEKVFGPFVRHRIDVKEKGNEYFCQELVTLCYLKAGYSIPDKLDIQDPSAVVPKDLMNRRVFILIESSMCLVGE